MRQAVRVASVPTAHPYVLHLDDPDRPRVHRLPDPVVAGRPAGVWWPHAALGADWVREHAGDFDVLHVHFGFEHRTPAELRDLVDAVRAAGRSLVVTVHDLRNPHEEDQQAHEERLAVLVDGADEVLTLTAGAAAVVRSRWGREALVVPHPHVLPLAQLGAARPPRGHRPVVGMHLKSLRTNVDERAVHAAVDELPDLDAVVRVHLHRDVAPADERRRALLGAVERAAAQAGVELVRHDPWDDDELHRRLRELDVLVLPYRHGTHSGMVELCADLGTAVVAPDVGFWHEQARVHRYRTGQDGPVTGSLRDAVRAALAAPAAPVAAAHRVAQRLRVAADHDAVYRRALRRTA
ncbi:hypothetical protein GCM10028777_38530 [Angustibacter speluncae]